MERGRPDATCQPQSRCGPIGYRSVLDLTRLAIPDPDRLSRAGGPCRHGLIERVTVAWSHTYRIPSRQQPLVFIVASYYIWQTEDLRDSCTDSEPRGGNNGPRERERQPERDRRGRPTCRGMHGFELPRPDRNSRANCRVDSRLQHPIGKL